MLKAAGRSHPDGMIGGDLRQIISKRESLRSDHSPFLIDQVQELLGFPGHRPGRSGPGDRNNPEEAHNQEGERGPTRPGGTTNDPSGASAATVECHQRWLSTEPPTHLERDSR
jgi:hypothetical protein